LIDLLIPYVRGSL